MPISLIITFLLLLAVICVEYFLFRKTRKNKDALLAAFITFVAVSTGYISNQFVDVQTYPNKESLVVLNKSTTELDSVLSDFVISADFRQNLIIPRAKVDDIRKMDNFFNSIGYYDLDKPSFQLEKKLHLNGYVNSKKLKTACFFQEETRINKSRLIETTDCLPFDIHFEKVFKGLHQIHLVAKINKSGVSSINRLQIPHKGAEFVNFEGNIYIISIPRADHLAAPEKQFASIVIHGLSDS